MNIGSVAVSAPELYPAGSGFKTQWSHKFYFLIKIVSIIKVRVRAVSGSGISSEWLRISDKPSE